MKKDRLNIKLREYVNCLSPTANEQDLIGKVYQSLNELFGVNNCIQIGSYPRFTAITPVHDLDILYILGNWDENNHSPEHILAELKSKIEKEYSNPTTLEIEVSLQSHSITIVFKKEAEEVLSIDIVPAYIFSKNEFGDDVYKVPELLKKNHGKRRVEFYKKLSETHTEMGWINSDPRGYIETTKRLNNGNEDFRKTVKLIKAWKNSCKQENDNFKLKSFHIEQVITHLFTNNSGLTIFDAMFKFFVKIPDTIKTPQIHDRADQSKYIDEYVSKLTPLEREIILQARDGFLIKLEAFSESDSVAELIEADFHTRASDSEQYLFDFGIPVLTDNNFSFSIRGDVQERKGSFRKYILDKLGIIAIDRKIKFDINGERPHVSLFKWKVQNDRHSEEPRGEITDNQTKNPIEHTKYQGKHFVECFAILDNVCVAKARQNVVLNHGQDDN